MNSVMLVWFSQMNKQNKYCMIALNAEISNSFSKTLILLAIRLFLIRNLLRSSYVINTWCVVRIKGSCVLLWQKMLTFIWLYVTHFWRADCKPSFFLFSWLFPIMCVIQKIGMNIRPRCLVKINGISNWCNSGHISIRVTLHFYENSDSC